MMHAKKTIKNNPGIDFFIWIMCLGL